VDAQEWGEEIPRDEVIDPVVFHFRPTKWIVIDEAHRADFEDFFFENVGFKVPAAVAPGVRPALPAYPNGGTSGSNGGWDD
jgi:hypothetical protein